MANYVGKTYRVAQIGGWNANSDADRVPKESMVEVENINIHKGGRQPRGGCEVVNATAITGTPEILGLIHFLREGGQLSGSYLIDESSDNIGDENGNSIISEGAEIVCGTNDGKIFSDYTTELKTGLEDDTRCFFEIYYDELFITNGIDKPQVYGQNQSATWDMGSPLACTAALAGSGAGNVDDGTHSYKITFVTSSGESSGGTTSNVVTVADQATDGQVALTSIPVGPTGTTSRKIYRTVAGDTGNHKLVDTIADNTTTTYTDNTADAGLGADSPTTSLAFLPTDWQDDWPKVFVKHGRGTHKRLWAYGVSTYPDRLYASANAVADFGDDNVIVIKIMADKITGLIESGRDLIIFGREKTFVMDDTAISTTNWGVQAAIWDGGAAHQNLIVKTPNDVAVMSEDGNIFSIKASEKYGDYEVASMTKPHYLDRWIEDNINLTLIDKFHAIYDPELRAIKWFMVSNDSDYPDVCLVYFIDYAMWTKHTYENLHEDKINHLCSSLIKISNALWEVYTGDDVGVVHRLESPIRTDAGVNYKSILKIPPLPMEDPRSSKLFDRGWIVVDPKGSGELYINIYIDDRFVGDYVVQIESTSDIMQNIAVYMGFAGLRAQLEIYNIDSSDFFISQIMLDYRELGRSDSYALKSAVLYGEQPVIRDAYIYGGRSAWETEVDLSDVDGYDVTTFTWTALTDMPYAPRYYCESTVILQDAYSILGYSTDVYQSGVTDVDKYVFSTNAWESRSNKTNGQTNNFGWATANNKGYVYGGLDIAQANTTLCFEYNSIGDNWVQKTNMTNNQNQMGAASVGYEVFAMYGSEAVSCNKYKIFEDVWESITDGPAPGGGVYRNNPYCFAVGDKVYVSGGVQVVLTVTTYFQDNEEYDTIENTWTSKTDMPSPARAQGGATTVLEKGYVFCGSIFGDEVADTDSYNPGNDAWTSLTDVPSPTRSKIGCT